MRAAGCDRLVSSCALHGVRVPSSRVCVLFTVSAVVCSRLVRRGLVRVCPVLGRYFAFWYYYTLLRAVFVVHCLFCKPSVFGSLKLLRVCAYLRRGRDLVRFCSDDSAP